MLSKAQINKIKDNLIKGLKKNKSWIKGWNMDNQKSCASLKSYGGKFNQLYLGIVKDIYGFKSNYWLTFNKMKRLKGYIMKGTIMQGFCFIPISHTYTKKDKDGNTLKDENGKPESYTFNSFKAEPLFNLSQIKGLSPKVLKQFKTDFKPLDFKPVEKAEQLITGYTNKPEIIHGGTKAFYSPSHDLIKLPQKANFKSVESYYKTLFHELAHSTGHHKRLNREGIKNGKFGDAVYSFEELIAEMTAVLLIKDSRLDTEKMNDNSQAYINGWEKQLDDNPEQIIKAFSQAQKGYKFITATA